MQSKKNQNRRQFILSSGWKGLMAGLGFLGISSTKGNTLAAEEQVCPDNILCRDCYKLGICEKKKADVTRKDIKANYYKVKVSKGINHGS